MIKRAFTIIVFAMLGACGDEGTHPTPKAPCTTDADCGGINGRKWDKCGLTCGKGGFCNDPPPVQDGTPCGNFRGCAEEGDLGTCDTVDWICKRADGTPVPASP